MRSVQKNLFGGGEEGLFESEQLGVVIMTAEEFSVFGDSFDLGDEGKFKHGMRMWLGSNRREVSFRGRFCWLGVRLYPGIERTWENVADVHNWVVHWYF